MYGIFLSVSENRIRLVSNYLASLIRIHLRIRIIEKFLWIHNIVFGIPVLYLRQFWYAIENLRPALLGKGFHLHFPTLTLTPRPPPTSWLWIRIVFYRNEDAHETMFTCKFGQFPCSWIQIRIRIPNTDPDPGQPWAVLRIRIHRIRIHRIRMFLGLPDPDPFITGMDPDPNPAIIKQI